MPSIIFSSDSPPVGEEIAIKTAESLGYEHVGRRILDEVAKKSGVTKADLLKALDDESSGRGPFDRNRYARLASIQAAVVERFLQDNIVCEGLAAHLYVREISHVLSVRVLTDLRLRTNRIAADKNISPKKARKLMEKSEKRQRKWSLDCFGIDEGNPSNYDMVINLGNIEVDQVVSTVADMISDRKFTAMTYSRKCLEDMALASRVRAALAERFPKVDVKARDGTVMLQMARFSPGWPKKAEKVKMIAREVGGVDYVEVHSDTSSLGKSDDLAQTK